MIPEISIILTILIITHAFSACVIVLELTEPGMILSHFHEWAKRRLPWWIHKPLISCERCVGGQLSFWGFIWWSWKLGWGYDPFLHLYTVLITIMITKFMRSLFQKDSGSYKNQRSSNWTPPEIQNQ